MTASVRLWSTTPGSNTNLDTGANWPEGMNPSAVNDAARGTQAAVRKMLNDLSAKIIAGGSANAITLTTDSGWVAGDLANGAALMFRAASTNTSATVTIAVDGLTAKNVFREDGTALRIGDIVANGIYIIAYSATAGGFLLLNGTLPSLSGARELLTADRTYYVRTDGSNSNNGLANSSGGAFLTVQKAIDTVAALDISTYNVTISVADGTYTGAIVVNGPWIGSGTVTIVGNTTTPANVIFSVTSHDAIIVNNNGSLIVSGMELRTTTSGSGLVATAGGLITLGSAVRFGACVAFHMYADTSGYISADVNYSIVGSAACHYCCVTQGLITSRANTVTLTGTPAFSSGFAFAARGGMMDTYSQTYSGSATGARYSATDGGLIFTNGAGTSYFPGNAAGSGTNYGTSPYGRYA